MFEKFGEFDGINELNAKAQELKDAGKEQELITLALENGISKEDAEDFIDGCVAELAGLFSAAVGKLKTEAKELEFSGILMDWVSELIDRCMNDTDFCIAVRKKGKSLAGYIALTADSGYENRCVVDKKVVELTKNIKKALGNHEFSIGIPDKKTRIDLQNKYYEVKK